MRKSERVLKTLGMTALVFFVWTYGQLSSLPPELTMLRGEAHSLPAFVAPDAARGGFLLQKDGARATVTPTETGSYPLHFSALGLFRRTATVSVVEPKKVVLGGKSVGIKMYMDGVLVVGLSEIPGTGRAPGKEAGIMPGDRILKINGTALSGSDALEKAVAESGGRELSVSVCREDKTSEVMITPVYYEGSGTYKIGLWVRESTAGIGTLTFSIPENGNYGALGHPIADADTGTRVMARGGSITECEIVHIQKGEGGAPGAVQGVFGEDVGSIGSNVEAGLYGTLKTKKTGIEVPVSVSTQVKKGTAMLISDISGKETAYTAEIERILHRNTEGTKNMVIRITDERLLRLTGGIVQGMSGSPILQDGKLIGAVTHVFVNDPTRGYGIFIENMLAEAE